MPLKEIDTAPYKNNKNVGMIFADYSHSDIGIHAASVGGICQALVMGYGGMGVNEEGLSLAPKLPEHIEAYHFRICYKGSKLLINVDSKKIRCSCHSENI